MPQPFGWMLVETLFLRDLVRTEFSIKRGFIEILASTGQREELKRIEQTLQKAPAE